MSEPNIETEESVSSKRDRSIVKAMPYIALACTVAGLIFAAFGWFGIDAMLLRFTIPYMIGFAALGAYSFRFRDASRLGRPVTTLIVLTVPLIAFFILWGATRDGMMPGIMEVLEKYMLTPVSEAVTILVVVYGITALFMLVSHGVLSTVVAYFRKFTARIFLSIEKIRNDGTDSRSRRFCKAMYDIPDIIDIMSVELEPVDHCRRFPKKMFTSIASSIFALGLLISSYIFLNPIFADAMTLEEAVLVTVIITFFVPVFVIPWHITKDVGAKVKSQARDYYLWKGLRKRLFEAFFTFTLLLSMFVIYVYFGYDLERTLLTYAGYVAITASLSLIYAFVYMNYYHKGFREGIIKSFADEKK